MDSCGDLVMRGTKKVVPRTTISTSWKLIFCTATLVQGMHVQIINSCRSDEIAGLFRGGLVFKAHRIVYHSTLGSRGMQKKKIARFPAPSKIPRQSLKRGRQKSISPQGSGFQKWKPRISAGLNDFTGTGTTRSTSTWAALSFPLSLSLYVDYPHQSLGGGKFPSNTLIRGNLFFFSLTSTKITTQMF